MRLMHGFWLGLLGLASLTNVLVLAEDSLPAVGEACEVIKHFRGEYSYGGWGLGAESNDGELAVWVIYHSPDAAKQLASIYAECQPSGKAYVLAALFHADKKAFRNLTNSFCGEPGYIIMASGCVGGAVSRPELVVQMQRTNSSIAFNPSRKPYRHSAMEFRGDDRDVYEEERQRTSEQEASRELAYAALASNPGLSAFTNLFRVEEAEMEDGIISGVYFSGPTQWMAHLIPKESLSYPTMVEIIFPSSNKVAQVGIVPAELLGELQKLVRVPFIGQLDKQLGVTCVRIRAAGDRLHWNTEAVTKFEQVLQTGISVRRWVQFIVDADPHKKRMISFFHPQGTDIYVVKGSLLENPDWRAQYRELTKEEPKKIRGSLDSWAEPSDSFIPVVSSAGSLRLVPSERKPRDAQP